MSVIFLGEGMASPLSSHFLTGLAEYLESTSYVLGAQDYGLPLQVRWLALYGDMAISLEISYRGRFCRGVLVSLESRSE